jgi:hypothetical protein
VGHYVLPGSAVAAAPTWRNSSNAAAVIGAAPRAVWALVADATRCPQWGPWSAAGYRGPADHAPGAVYWLRSATRAYGR